MPDLQSPELYQKYNEDRTGSTLPSFDSLVKKIDTKLKTPLHNLNLSIRNDLKHQKFLDAN
jgi:hypothetical protein